MRNGGGLIRFRAAIFDLDGTLVDTLHDIAASMNAVLASRGLPVHDTAAYRLFVGDGMETLVRRVLPDELAGDPALVAGCLADMRREYRRRCYNTSRPYRGIPEMLAALAAKGARLAVLSNKPQDFTAEMVERYFRDVPFLTIRGLRDGTPKKPNPAGALLIAREAGLPPDAFFYLGDTATDMATALDAGMYPAGAAWGFRGERELIESGAAAVLHHPGEVVPLFTD